MHRSLLLRLAFAAAALVLVEIDAVDADQRGLLWRVVQGCLLNASLTGLPFPCLEVETGAGRDAGFAVIRAPLDKAHIIITPTVRTIGIEAPRLRGADAPNYFADAWASRHFVSQSVSTEPDRNDLALALNSRPGRSQDQLHVHVACIRGDVRAAVLAHDAEIRSGSWTRFKVLPYAPAYAAQFEPSPDLVKINVIDRVAAGLKLQPKDMHDVTIVMIGAKATSRTPAGFYLLARRRLPHGFDTAHGEALLDPSCARFARR